ncbi:MAG: LON peptidase substrate-binding domain-containing protein, partial [Symbiobacteriaceae bacterium]|nr:LON peptidase substrate-binding domain-containing protein [Symbiobacteriaceae bacterium]
MNETGQDGNLILPVLPLRGLLIFPHTILRFDVGRQRSVAALEYAFEAPGQQVLLLTQNDAQVTDPTEEQLNRVGVVAYIREMTYKSNVAQVVVTAQQRAKVKRIFNSQEMDQLSDLPTVESPPKEPIMMAVAELLVETPPNELEQTVLHRMLIEALPRYNQTGKKLNQELLNSAKDIYHIGKLCDLIAAQLQITWQEKQQLLEELNVTLRAEELLHLIERTISLIDVERRIEGNVRRQMEKNQRDYYLREQMRAIQKELGEKESRTDEATTLREQLQGIKAMEESWKNKVHKEIDRYERIPPSSAESGVLKTYLDTVFDLPWDNLSEDHLDIEEAERILNADHYGLEKPKERILEYLAVRHLTQSLKGPILCLAGPPGTGKTSLAKSVAKALGRKFVRLSLGGIRDEAEIRGHR